MMAVKWQDKKPVTILTMMHNNNGMMDKTSMKTGELVKKPKPVLDCNRGGGGGGGGEGGGGEGRERRWWWWTEWTSSLHPTLSCAVI